MPAASGKTWKAIESMLTQTASPWAEPAWSDPGKHFGIGDAARTRHVAQVSKRVFQVK